LVKGRSRPWRILVVDDDTLASEQIERKLSASKFGSTAVAEVTTTVNFSEAIHRLEDCRFDLTVLDVRYGQAGGKQPRVHAGIRTLETIRRTRFLPVVFYTGVAHLVDELAIFPLVTVVRKTAGVNELATQVSRVFRSGLPSIGRLLNRELEEAQRQYMWEFVAKHWRDVEALHDPERLAKVLASRIAASMDVLDASPATQRSP
jgi:CheY-like chemotaxis protein